LGLRSGNLPSGFTLEITWRVLKLPVAVAVSRNSYPTGVGYSLGHRNFAIP
jgi:hypothetical protein